MAIGRLAPELPSGMRRRVAVVLRWILGAHAPAIATARTGCDRVGVGGQELEVGDGPGLDLGNGRTPGLASERLVVHDDGEVDAGSAVRRFEPGDGELEDAGDGIGVALVEGAGQVVDRGLVTVDLPCFGPVGLELGLDERPEDHLHPSARDPADEAQQLPPAVEVLHQPGPPVLVRATSPIRRAVLVDLADPVGEAPVELVVGEHRRELGHLAVDPLELGLHPGVDPHPGDPVDLAHPDGPGCQPLPHRRHRTQAPSHPVPALRLRLRQPPGMAHQVPGRRVTVGQVETLLLDRVDHADLHRVEAPVEPLHPPGQRQRAVHVRRLQLHSRQLIEQRIELVELPEDGRCGGGHRHTPIISRGSDSEATSLGFFHVMSDSSRTPGAVPPVPRTA